MAEIFKTLEFKDSTQKTFRKYAHPIRIGKSQFGWISSDLPMLMTTNTIMEDLKQLYKGLDFSKVNLVLKKLSDPNVDWK